MNDIAVPPVSKSRLQSPVASPFCNGAGVRTAQGELGVVHSTLNMGNYGVYHDVALESGRWISAQAQQLTSSSVMMSELNSDDLVVSGRMPEWA